MFLIGINGDLEGSKSGNLVRIVQTNDRTPVIVTVSGNSQIGSSISLECSISSTEPDTTTLNFFDTEQKHDSNPVKMFLIGNNGDLEGSKSGNLVTIVQTNDRTGYSYGSSISLECSISSTEPDTTTLNFFDTEQKHDSNPVKMFLIGNNGDLEGSKSGNLVTIVQTNDRTGYSYG
ncbi:unnamed protein product [Phaedon cochleariae]|uniref:Uncharacterized protein n=1 Tax=Phaedon cochleariae TaxID=80249 RepID=A0A9N9SF49_PHACE|nr:unnamed protein product [Phaedon cochleariae]